MFFFPYSIKKYFATRQHSKVNPLLRVHGIKGCTKANRYYFICELTVLLVRQVSVAVTHRVSASSRFEFQAHFQLFWSWLPFATPYWPLTVILSCLWYFLFDKGECLYYDIMGYDTVYSGRRVLVCRRNTEDPSDTFVNSYQTTRCYMTQNHGATRLNSSENNWLLKAKLSLFLTKNTLWKHKGSGGTAPRFLNLDIRWLWLVTVTPSVTLFSG